MRHRAALLVTLSVLLSSTAAAVIPGTDVYVPSAGKGQGSCVNNVCAQFDTTVWVYNPQSQAASVQIFFLPRDQANPNPQSIIRSVAPGATLELQNVVQTITGAPSGFGALRVLSNVGVVVTSRIFDSNVVTNRGSGSAGQYFAGIPATFAIGTGGSTDLIGLTQDAEGSAGVARTNFGFTEVTGNSATVEVKRYDGNGTLLATKNYNLGARQPLQISISDVGGPVGTNHRLHVAVVGGTGRVLPFASVIQNGTGDPTTVDMAVYSTGSSVSPGALSGGWTGEWENVTFASSGSATMTLTINTTAQTISGSLDLGGNVFGMGDPPAFSFSGPWTPGGGTFSSTSAIGTFTISIDAAGRIRGSVTGIPGGSINRMEFVGAVLPRVMTFEYTVFFNGGVPSEAWGYLFMRRQGGGA